MTISSETAENVPISVRLPAFMPTLRTFDKETVDFTEELMPDAPSPEGVNSNFHWLVRVDSQMIAPTVDYMTKVKYVETSLKNETFYTKSTGLGLYLNPEQFDREVGAGKIGINLAAKMREVAGGIKRKIMYDRLSYISGNTATVARFSTQDVERLKVWNATSDSDFGSGKGGCWSTLTTDMFWQLDLVLRYAAELTSEPLTNFYFGPDTEFNMNQNSTLKTLIQSVVDLRGKPIGQELRGLRLFPIRGDTFKEDSGNERLWGAPGTGSLSYNTWSAIKTKHMMRHNVAGTEYEYGLLCASKLGFTWRPPFYQQELYPKENVVVDSWWTHGPRLYFTEVRTRYGFVVEDMAKIHRIDQLSISRL